MPIKSIKMKISRKKEVFLFHVKRSLNSIIKFLGQKVCPVARPQTHRQSDYLGHPFRVSGFFPPIYLIKDRHYIYRSVSCESNSSATKEQLVSSSPIAKYIMHLVYTRQVEIRQALLPAVVLLTCTLVKSVNIKVNERFGALISFIDLH